MKAKIKVVVQAKRENVPGWPHINFNYGKETERIMEIVRSENPDMDFDVVTYHSVDEAKADYESDKRTYDGVLVLVMTNWIRVDLFYARQAKDGIPTVLADVPFCGSGSTLSETSYVLRTEKLPVSLVASTDYGDIARAIRVFAAIQKMKNSTILVVKNEIETEEQEAASRIWGCKFVNRTGAELMEIYNTIPDADAKPIAKAWADAAVKVVEPSENDLLESAKLYLAMKKMQKETGADALTIACLELSYNDHYGNNCHMYPCLAYHQMANDGEIGVCEADINATVSAMITYYMTGKPGFVSDPVVDTSSGEIIYAHCVACKKVFGVRDARTCSFNIRSHAEDQKGASVQVIFPTGEPLTTVTVCNVKNWATIHSATSVGNSGGDCGCRSKLVASCEADKLLQNWMPLWHRVTVFGDYRRVYGYLFKMKGYEVIEEDK